MYIFFDESTYFSFKGRLRLLIPGHFVSHQSARQSDACALKCVTASEKVVWYGPIPCDIPVLTFCVRDSAGVLLGPL